jgi:AraC family ethanolamine operon transcriptional activator
MRATKVERYRQTINRFESIVRARIREPLCIADICQLAGVSERSLSRAFREVGDTTAYRHLQVLRLNELRQALLSESEPGTVTEVALRFGFSEFGRLAAHYRILFGESPSDSRRRALCGTHSAHQNGDRDVCDLKR